MNYKEGIIAGLIIGGSLTFAGTKLATRIYTGADVRRTRMADDKQSYLYLETGKHGFYRITEDAEGNLISMEKYNPQQQAKLVPAHATRTR